MNRENSTDDLTKALIMLALLILVVYGSVKSFKQWQRTQIELEEMHYRQELEEERQRLMRQRWEK